MNPMLKKAIAALAIKEGIEKVQEMRRPKPSLLSRLSPMVWIAALGGALFYLNKTGRLSPMVDQVKEMVGGSGSNGSQPWEGNGAAAPTAPSTTSV